MERINYWILVCVFTSANISATCFQFMTYFPDVASFKDTTPLGVFWDCGVWLQDLSDAQGGVCGRLNSPTLSQAADVDLPLSCHNLSMTCSQTRWLEVVQRPTGSHRWWDSWWAYWASLRSVSLRRSTVGCRVTTAWLFPPALMLLCCFCLLLETRFSSSWRRRGAGRRMGWKGPK